MVKNSSPLLESDHLDARIAAIAERQYGNITTEQLLSLGLTYAAIAYREATGRLHRLFQGVYAVGTMPTEPIARAAAAKLACGEGAALSHGSALTLWGLWKRWDEPFEVTVERRVRRQGIRVHRRKLGSEDVTAHRRFTVTTPARTLLDMAPRLEEKSLRRLVNDARRQGLVTIGELASVISRYPRRPGAPLLRPFITNPTAPTRSELEDRFLDFCRRFKLPQPLVNTRVAGFEVDALFPTERLIVELDGYEFHGDRHSFESNRERDTTTLAAGFLTVRITWRRITEQPEKEAALLHSILEQRQR